MVKKAIVFNWHLFLVQIGSSYININLFSYIFIHITIPKTLI
ncbi:hypothetical protein HMPREF0352_2711 [Enterococcus faecium TX1330]|nr:hypothetical protein HMPREF0352_2711 [Enterococcus faecium TX1330]